MDPVLRHNKSTYWAFVAGLHHAGLIRWCRWPCSLVMYGILRGEEERSTAPHSGLHSSQHPLPGLPFRTDGQRDVLVGDGP